jgi:UPF0176 protein
MVKASPKGRTTVSFYKYWNMEDPHTFRDELYLKMDEVGVMGRIYVAKEGVNAQISVPDENIEAFRENLYSFSFLDGCRLNFAVQDEGMSFYKLKVKVRKKIVADGLNDNAFDVTDIGVHVDAARFNELTSQNNTVLIDMRNHYESEVGHFDGAILPDADTFREELPMVEEMIKGKEDQNIVMYCTGGIRCEKASAYFKSRGFQNVFQLEGGIIKYARDVKSSGLENKFKGKNFVFDERLGERISDEIIAECHQCGKQCDDHTNCNNEGCNLLFIQCDECKAKYENCCSTDCQEIIKLPEDEQKKIRQENVRGRLIYKKGRWPKDLKND